MPDFSPKYCKEYCKDKLNQFKGKPCLAVDYGKKIVGLAKFIPLVEPFPTIFGKIIFQNNEHLIKEIKKICDDESIEVLIVGVPYYPDGQESKMTLEIKSFVESLQKNISLDIFTQDESYSTRSAKDRMLESPLFNFKIDPKKIDEIAAVIILEDFFK